MAMPIKEEEPRTPYSIGERSKAVCTMREVVQVCGVVRPREGAALSYRVLCADGVERVLSNAALRSKADSRAGPKERIVGGHSGIGCEGIG